MVFGDVWIVFAKDELHNNIFLQYCLFSGSFLGLYKLTNISQVLFFIHYRGCYMTLLFFVSRYFRVSFRMILAWLFEPMVGVTHFGFIEHL